VLEEVEGVEEITSRAGLSSITIEFNWGTMLMLV